MVWTISTQRIGLHHESRLRKMEDHLNTQRLRASNRLWKDIHRLERDLIQLQIRTPNTTNIPAKFRNRPQVKVTKCSPREEEEAGSSSAQQVAKTNRPDQSSNGSKKTDAKSKEAANRCRDQGFGDNASSDKSETAAKYVRCFLQHSKSRQPAPTASLVKVPQVHVTQDSETTKPTTGRNAKVDDKKPITALPTVEVQGSVVQYRYEGAAGGSRTFTPNSKTKLLLQKTSQIAATLNFIHHRQSCRRLSDISAKDGTDGNGNAKAGNASREVFETLLKGWSHGISDRFKRAKKDRRKAKIRSVLKLMSAFRDRAASTSTDPGDSSLPGVRLVKHYRLWTNADSQPVWATAQYRQRRSREETLYQSRQLTDMHGAVVQAMNAERPTLCQDPLSASKTSTPRLKSSKRTRPEPSEKPSSALVAKAAWCISTKPTPQIQLRPPSPAFPGKAWSPRSSTAGLSPPEQRRASLSPAPSTVFQANSDQSSSSIAHCSSHSGSLSHAKAGPDPPGDGRRASNARTGRRGFAESGRLVRNVSVLALRRPLRAGRTVVLERELKLSVGNVTMSTGLATSKGNSKRHPDVYVKSSW